MIESSISKTMMMEKIMSSSWSEQGSEDDELLRELLDDETPLFMLPQERVNEISNNMSHDSSKDQPFNRFISNIYSGPTISDIENALLVTNQRETFPQISSTRYEEHINILFLITNYGYLFDVCYCVLFQSFYIGRKFE